VSEVAIRGEVERFQNYRKQIPKEHRFSLATRLRWLFNQRWGTVQTVRMQSPDTNDVLAATIISQAIWGNDLDSIILIYQQLEGAPQSEEAVAEQRSMRV